METPAPIDREAFLALVPYARHVLWSNALNDGPKLHGRSAELGVIVIPKCIEYGLDLHTLSSITGLFWCSNEPRSKFWRNDENAQENYARMIFECGISCQVFCPEMWRGCVTPFEMWRINIKPGYELFFCCNSDHKARASAWMSDKHNIEKENPWDALVREGRSMTQIFVEENCPSSPPHFMFYKENNFGACLRQTTHGMFIQIIDKDCIDGDWVREKISYKLHSMQIESGAGTGKRLAWSSCAVA
jgi:hypothetical protein